MMVPREKFIETVRKISDFIDNGMSLSPDERDARFDSLALEIFALQYEGIPSYRRFCDSRRVTPDCARSYLEIPPVPVQAFKAGDIFMFEPSEAKLVFKTSGTTGSRPGMAYFSEPGERLASRAIVANASSYLFPDGAATRFFLIAPPPAAAPNLTMAYGVTEVMKNTGPHGGRHYMGAQGIDWNALFADIEETISNNVPACVIAPSFAVVFVLDKMAAEGRRYGLPAGSRLLDAGGFKGRSREIDRAGMVAMVEDRLGIDPRYCVNALGMSELSTQYYDNMLKSHILGLSVPACKENPHWARTHIADPSNGMRIVPRRPEASGGDAQEQLKELSAAASDTRHGVLVHYDLANIDRALGILTDDTGSYLGSGFAITGRVSKDDLKGCSLTIEELLTGAPR